jgi:hypothetical protein
LEVDALVLVTIANILEIIEVYIPVVIAAYGEWLRKNKMAAPAEGCSRCCKFSASLYPGNWGRFETRDLGRRTAH